MGVGFIRPHTPLIVPKRFFDMFPVNEISLLRFLMVTSMIPLHKQSEGFPTEKNLTQCTEDMGSKLFHKLVESMTHETKPFGILSKPILPASSVDEQVGRILDVIDSTELKDNTIIVLTSDHGWGMGEKTISIKIHFGRRAHESTHRASPWSRTR